MTTAARRIELATADPVWLTVVAAAEGDRAAGFELLRVRHALLDDAWAQSSKVKRMSVAWAALMACREMDARSATGVIAAFLARDPSRTLPKVAMFRPVAFVIADNGETAQPWPTNDKGMRLTGRLVWFIDGSGGIGQLSWPKVTERERASPKELVARVGRLVVHDQIVAFRAGASAADCELCSQRLEGALHVDHAVQFDDLLDDWIETAGGYDSVAAKVTNPSDADPHFVPEHEGAWYEWHREHAVLRLTHAKCILNRPRSGSI